MNRRSLISTICTSTLAFLAPVAALAKPYRKVLFGSYGVKGIILGRGTDHIQDNRDNWEWDPFDPRNRKAEFACTEWNSRSFPSGPTGEYPCSKCGQPTLHDEPDPKSLHALLAEARSHLEMWHRVFGVVDDCDTEHLLSRIDGALKCTS